MVYKGSCMKLLVLIRSFKIINIHVLWRNKKVLQRLREFYAFDGWIKWLNRRMERTNN